MECHPTKLNYRIEKVSIARNASLLVVNFEAIIFNVDQ